MHAKSTTNQKHADHCCTHGIIMYAQTHIQKPQNHTGQNDFYIKGHIVLAIHSSKV